MKLINDMLFIDRASNSDWRIGFFVNPGLQEI